MTERRELEQQVLDIDARGLHSALEEMAVRIRDDYRVKRVFRYEQEILFRETQTATNAFRHGRAKQIAISLVPLL